MIRENYFYENINELEFDKNGQYKWGKFNNILNENKKNIEKSLKIDGILLNSLEGIKESRYKEELFTRLTEINQTTNLKKYLYFLRQTIRLFIREKDRLQNIVTSSSTDSSESDSSSETEEVTDNNLSGKDFNQKISTFLASKQKDLNRNFDDADRVSVALLSYIKKELKKLLNQKEIC